jgi:hypothetical protein
MIRSTRCIFLGLILAIGLTVSPVQAQLGLALGLGRLISSSPEEGIAGKLDLVLPFEWFFDCSGCNYFEVSPGLVLPLTVKGVGPYVGAGLNFAHISFDSSEDISSDTRLGLALNAGLLAPIKGLTSFAEARFTAGGANQTVILAGVYLGRRRQ